MLTSFISSQHDHGGYFCMGINNSLSFERVDISLLPWSLGADFRETRVWPARLNPPCLSSLPPLSFSPFSHFTHLQPDGLLTEWSLKFNCLPVNTSLPDSKPSKLTPKRHGVWVSAYVSAVEWSQLQ